jgi:hypothetical protein
MRRSFLAPLALLLGAAAARAQSAQPAPTTGALELRPMVGAYVPIGALRDQLKTATTAGVHVAFEVSPKAHLVGGGAWTHGHHKFAASSDRVDLWQFDVGAEFNLVRRVSPTWLLRPFVGAGAGVRTKTYRADGFGQMSCAAGYASLGAELQHALVAYRLEGRDYAVCDKSPTTGVKSTRNEARVAFGVAFHLRGTR